jgi:hypothetical protein
MRVRRRVNQAAEETELSPREVGGDVHRQGKLLCIRGFNVSVTGRMT